MGDWDVADKDPISHLLSPATRKCESIGQVFSECGRRPQTYQVAAPVAL
jgi:hypothetical protein